jgi:light-regulated signal transduction histidine kinase (bacteriophytochrome)
VFLGLALLLYRFVNYNPGFVTLVAVIVVAWRYGVGPAFLSSFVGAYGIRVAFLGKSWIPEPADFLRFGVYLGFTYLISELSLGRRKAEDALREANQALENRVRERTADLEARTRELEEANLALRRQIEERERAEAALSRNMAALQRSNAALEQYAYIASHDLREPLRSISAFVQLLDRRYRTEMGEEARFYVEQAVSGVHRMEALIRDLLAYSRAGRETAFEWIDADEVVDTACLNCSESIKESGAEIVRPSRLPRVFADRGGLAQVFQNLLQNAIKYRQKDAPRIEIGCEETESGAHFWVRDNGVGIDPRYHDQIFIIFQRLQPRQDTGTGIGLAICKAIVERHHGRIWVESQVGLGSTFHFTVNAASSPIAIPAAVA